MLYYSSPKGRLALRLFDEGAFKTRGKGPGFRLKLHDMNPSAPLSPFYLNLRTPNHSANPSGLSETTLKAIVRELYLMALEGAFTYDAVAGIPEAGEPYAELFADYKRMFFPQTGLSIVKLKKSTHPGGRRITGVQKPSIPRGSRILLIDDLITGADTKWEAISVLTRSGFQVEHVLVIVDRMQGGKQELARRGFYVHSVFTIRDLVSLYRKTERMSEKNEKEILLYLGMH